MLWRTTGLRLTREAPATTTAAGGGGQGGGPTSAGTLQPLLSRPVDLILHIGADKTGTSSLQCFLRDNRERLGELGVLFPVTPGATRHELLGLFAKSDGEVVTSPEWPRQGYSDVGRFRRRFRRELISEIESRALDRVLLTDEVLFGSSEATLRRLGRFAHRMSSNVTVVAYLRRQDDYLVGRYQERVKVGWVARLRDWAREDLSDLCDYDDRLRRIERLLGPCELVVRRYERDSFADGSLYQDFLDAAGIAVRADTLEQGPDRNQSLDAESIEFIRLLSLYRIENEGATPGLIDNRALSMRLLKSATGPALSLPDPQVSAFMEQWEKSNARVARRYLHDVSGELFRAPRKTNVTTEQRLDPARLDHFFAVADVHERQHEPLRRIAEREAGSW